MKNRIDIDIALTSLSVDEHPRLGEIERGVMNGVRERREARHAVRMAAISGLGAVALGAASVGIRPQPASAAPLAPFGAAAPLAPSTLLATDR